MSGHDLPAFPTTRLDGTVEDGLTIRDYFAGKAMERAMSEVDSWITKREQERLAVLAYAIADAMLKARAA